MRALSVLSLALQPATRSLLLTTTLCLSARLFSRLTLFWHFQHWLWIFGLLDWAAELGIHSTLYILRQVFFGGPYHLGHSVGVYIMYGLC